MSDERELQYQFTDLALENRRLRAEVETLESDVLRLMEIRALALYHAATYCQPGPDGQDYIDRARLIHQWVEEAYESHAAGERVNGDGYEVIVPADPPGQSEGTEQS